MLTILLRENRDRPVHNEGHMETEAEIGMLRKAMEKLSDREREIIELRYGYNRKNDKEMTQKEVADLLGISQSYISRLEKKIMLRLRREIQRVES